MEDPRIIRGAWDRHWLHTCWRNEAATPTSKRSAGIHVPSRRRGLEDVGSDQAPHQHGQIATELHICRREEKRQAIGMRDDSRDTSWQDRASTTFMIAYSIRKKDIVKCLAPDTRIERRSNLTKKRKSALPPSSLHLKPILAPKVAPIPLLHITAAKLPKLLVALSSLLRRGRRAGRL